MCTFADGRVLTANTAKKVSPGTPWGDIAAAGALTALGDRWVAALLEEANKKSGRKKS